MYSRRLDSAPNDGGANRVENSQTAIAKDFLLELCRYSIAGLIMFSVALPSGSVFGIPVKHIFYISSILSLFFLWVRGEVLSRQLLFLLILTSVFVLLFTLIGFFKDATESRMVVQEAIGVFTAVSVVIIVEFARERRWIDSSFILSAAFWGVFVFATFKSLVGLILALKVVSFDQVYSFFLNNLNYRIVSAGIFGGMVRINLIIYDFVVGVMLFVVVAYPQSIPNVPKIARYIFVPIGLACLLFAYSRLLFFIAAVLFGFIWIFRWTWRPRVFSALLLILAAVYFVQWIEGAFNQRFVATQNSGSDQIRIEQVDALLSEWAKAPLVGGGFGYYSKDVVRDLGTPYNYEVQWVGFLAKLGSIGVSFLVGLVVLLYVKVLKGPRTIGHLPFLFTLSCFIFGGFTNQYLVASGSGVFYCIHLAMAEYFRLNSYKV